MLKIKNIKKCFLVLSFISLSFLTQEVVFNVADFSSMDTQNLIGGPSGTFDKDPNNTQEYCKLSFEESVDGRKNVMKLEYRVSEEGFNGYYTKLQNFDARPYQNLVFWIKADRPMKRIKLEIKGKGGVGFYILRNITTEFKKVVIPFKDFRKISHFGGLKEFVIVFDGTLLGDSQGVVYIDDICFTAEKKFYEEKVAEIAKEPRENFDFVANMSDDELLEFISKRTFDYFIKEAGAETGFVKDRSTIDSPSSIAATGFGLAAICIGVERKWISYEEGFARVMKILSSIRKKEGVNGFYYHFVDKDTGERSWNSELSSIDTALLLGGVVVAREYFNDKELKRLADEIISGVNWRWMMNERTKQVYMGWDPDTGFKNFPLWDTYAEMLMMYIFGLGAPKQYALPVESWHSFKRPIKKYKNFSYICSPGESMFVYQYSHAFIDFRDIKDDYTNYWENSLKAIVQGYEFCKNNASNSKTYKEFWGISASDGPLGYRNYGATPFAQDGTIAPYAVCGAVPFLGEIAIKTLREMILKLQDKVFREYGFVSAINLDKNYFADEHIGIDLGISLLMIENYRSGFVWKYFMKNQVVQNGLKRAGFKPGKEGVKLEDLLKGEAEKVEITLKGIEIKRTAKDVKLDGDISEWDKNSFYKFTEEDLEFGSIENPADFNAEFSCCYNEKKLYLCVVINDNMLYNEYIGREIYMNDCVEVYVNPTGKILTWGDKKNFQIGFSAPNDNTNELCYAWFQNENPASLGKVNFVSKKTDSGYVIEASIDLDYLNINLQKNPEVGFSLAVHDVDIVEGTKVDKKVNYAFKNIDNKLHLGTMKFVK